MSQNIIVEPSDEQHEDLNLDQKALTKIEPDPAAEAPKSDLPEKYAGKTFEDVVALHQNLEKEYGRQGNEIGTYRELVSSLASSKRVDDLSEEGPTESKPVEVTTDNLWDNPTEAISSVVKEVLARELEPLRANQVQSEILTAHQQLLSEFPDAETIGNDPGFVEFVEKSPYRLQDAQNWVEKHDVDSARRLLTDYKQYSSVTSTKLPEAEEVGTPATQTPVQKARSASTEAGRGGSASNSGRQTIHREQVLKLIASNPEKYRSKSFQDELRKAIDEGRFIDD